MSEAKFTPGRPFRKCGLVSVVAGDGVPREVPFEGVGDYVITPYQGPGFLDQYSVTHHILGFRLPTGPLTLAEARILSALSEVRMPKIHRQVNRHLRGIWISISSEAAALSEARGEA